MKITRKSALSGRIGTLELDVTQEQLDDHAAGKFAQDAFPNLSPDEREFIMTGITAAEWETMFNDA